MVGQQNRRARRHLDQAIVGELGLGTRGRQAQFGQALEFLAGDDYEQKRYYYLIEGEKMLIFLQQGFDETTMRTYRNLIDTYPATEMCNSRSVFDLMVRDMVIKK